MKLFKLFSLVLGAALVMSAASAKAESIIVTFLGNAGPATTYNYMRGVNPDSSDIIDPTTGLPTKFQVPGDPVTGTGWLDSNPADRRLQTSTGPFTMALGDSREITIAIMVGQGTDRLSSISDLRSKDDVAQVVFDLNFDICPPPPSPTVYVQPIDKGVRLVWGSEPVGFNCVNLPLKLAKLGDAARRQADQLIELVP